MTKRQLIILVITVFILALVAIGIRVMTMPGGLMGVPEHITIAQAAANQSAQVLKVGGEVAPGSISWNDTSQSISFMLSDEGEKMPVLYRGRVPNDFKPYAALVVEGMFNSSGVFEAVSLTTRSSPLCKACHGNG